MARRVGEKLFWATFVQSRLAIWEFSYFGLGRSYRAPYVVQNDQKHHISVDASRFQSHISFRFRDIREKPFFPAIVGKITFSQISRKRKVVELRVELQA